MRFIGDVKDLVFDWVFVHLKLLFGYLVTYKGCHSSL